MNLPSLNDLSYQWTALLNRFADARSDVQQWAHDHGIAALGTPEPKACAVTRDPHMAEVTDQTPKERFHAGTDNPPHCDANKPFGPCAYDISSYNCASFAWHAGQGEPAHPANLELKKTLPHWDNGVLDDMARSRRLTPQDKLQIGDVIAYGVDSDDADCRIERSGYRHVGIVMEVDAQGKAVRIAGKDGFSYVSDHHPAQPGGVYLALGRLLVEWYRPDETPAHREARIAFAREQLAQPVIAEEDVDEHLRVMQQAMLAVDPDFKCGPPRAPL